MGGEHWILSILILIHTSCGNNEEAEVFSEKIDVIVAKSKTSNEQDERNYCWTESILREVFYLLNLIACFTCM